MKPCGLGTTGTVWRADGRNPSVTEKHREIDWRDERGKIGGNAKEASKFPKTKQQEKNARICETEI